MQKEACSEEEKERVCAYWIMLSTVQPQLAGDHQCAPPPCLCSGSQPLLGKSEHCSRLSATCLQLGYHFFALLLAAVPPEVGVENLEKEIEYILKSRCWQLSVLFNKAGSSFKLSARKIS